LKGGHFFKGKNEREGEKEANVWVMGMDSNLFGKACLLGVPKEGRRGKHSQPTRSDNSKKKTRERKRDNREKDRSSA